MILTLCLNPVIQKTIVYKQPLVKGMVNRISSHRIDAAGKGINVSRVLTQLGHNVTHITQVGGFLSEFFNNLCINDNIKLDSVTSSSDIRFCYTLIDDDVTEMVEEGSKIDAELEQTIIKKVCSYLHSKNSGKPSVFLLSGSKAPGFSENIFPTLVYEALKNDIPVIADFRGKDLLLTLQKIKYLEHKNYSFYCKPNAQELCDTFLCNNSENDIKTCIRNLWEEFHCNSIITRGTKPLVSCLNSICEIIPIKSVLSPQNTTGCGDAFAAGFASMLSQNESAHDALRKGIECGYKNALTIRPGSIY